MARIATSLMMMAMLTLGLAACGQNTPRLSVGSSVSKAVTLPSLPSITNRSHKTKQETVAPAVNPTVNPEDHGLILSTTPVASIQPQPVVLAKNNATNPYLPPYEEQPTQTKAPNNTAAATSVTTQTNQNNVNAIQTPKQTISASETSNVAKSQPSVNHQTNTVQPAPPANHVTAPSQAKAVNAINQNDVPAIEASQSLFTPQQDMAEPSAGIAKAPIATPGQTVNSPASKAVNNNVAPVTTKPIQTVQPSKPVPMAASSKPMQSQNTETVSPSAAVASKPVSEKPMQPQTAVTTTPTKNSVSSSVKKPTPSVSSNAINAVPESAKPAASTPMSTIKPATPAVNLPKSEAAAVESSPTKATTAPNNASTQKPVTLPEPPKPAPPAPGSLNRPSVQSTNEQSNQALPSAAAPSGYNRPSYQRFNEPSNEPSNQASPSSVKPNRPAPTSFDQVPVPVLN